MPSSTRAPRLKVNVNGVLLTGAFEAEVANKSHFAADTFRVTAAIGALPATMPLAWWSSTPLAFVEVFAGFDNGAGNVPWFSLIYGQVDDVSIDLVRRTLTLTGRDLSGQFIDAKTVEKFQNLTASQIAQQLALRHGMDSTVQATTAPSGTYYEIDHARLTQEQSEWDLLTYLAEQEGFDVWVSGQTLYFQPSPIASATPYQLTWIEPGDGTHSANFIDIRLERALTLARDVIVKVKSWHQGQEKSFVVTYHVSQASKSQQSGGSAQLYSYTVPNLTPAQALQWATNKAEEITRHERVIGVDLPGDNLLTTRKTVKLTGTRTGWDQTYYPDTVERHISADGGYRMTLRAKNHSPQSTVVT